MIKITPKYKSEEAPFCGISCNFLFEFALSCFKFDPFGVVTIILGLFDIFPVWIYFAKVMPNKKDAIKKTEFFANISNSVTRFLKCKWRIVKRMIT